MPSGLFGCSFGFPVGSCFDLGHLHICQGVRGKAWAHAFNGLLVRRSLLLQSADHVLHFALPRQEVLHARLQWLDLLPCSLSKTVTHRMSWADSHAGDGVQTEVWLVTSQSIRWIFFFPVKDFLNLPGADYYKSLVNLQSRSKFMGKKIINY